MFGGVETLNGMVYGLNLAAPSLSQASAAQRGALDRLAKAYRRTERPPSDLSAKEVSSTLLGSAAACHVEAVGNVCGYERGAVVPLCDCLSASDGELLMVDTSKLIFSRVEEASNLLHQDLGPSYVDLAFEGPIAYGEFLRDLADRNSIQCQLQEARAHAGIFFVEQKSRKQMLILDTRRSNCSMAPPDHIDLASISSIGDLELFPGARVWMGQGDIEKCYYFFGVPNHIAQHFGLPSISAKYLHLSSLGGDICRQSHRDYTCFCGCAGGVELGSLFYQASS